MIKNYIKIAWRSILKNKGYSFLNIFGLAIGITCASLIFLWVEDELNFDNYFANKEQIYKVKNHQSYGDETFIFDATPGLLADQIKKDIPGIEKASRSSIGLQKQFNLKDKKLLADGRYVDTSYFDIFQFHFIEGSAKRVFQQLNSIVLTESLATKLFGNTKNVVGKSVTIDKDQQYVITAIIEDLPENTSLHFEWLLPIEVYENNNGWMKYWASNGLFTYVQLEPNASLKKINKQIYNYIGEKREGTIAKLSLYPMSRWRLYDSFENGKEVPGRIKYVKLFSLIAWIILIIACINFMNLSTARSQKRAHEVGVRKVLGTNKSKLIIQFLSESILTSLLAMVIAIGLVYLFMPLFNGLVEKELAVSLFKPSHLVFLLGVAILSGLISGIFPAYYLSSFTPLKVLKGLRVKEGSAGAIRKGLVILQFSASVILIVSTILIYQQIQHIKNRNLGYDKQHLVYTEVNDGLKNHFDVVQNQLLQSGFIEHVSVSSSTPLHKNSNTANFDWPGKDPNTDVLINFDGVTPDYIETLGITIKKGRDFYENSKSDSTSVLINESFADIIGTDDLIGSTIKFQNQQFTVIGVVGNFIYNNLYEKPSPLVFYRNNNGDYLNIRFKKNIAIDKALSKVGTILANNSPDYLFKYNFVDSKFNNSFKTETLIGKLAGVFAMLAIFISCLGLFGLAAYTAEQRKKEIGIRKVLGASVDNLAKLLSVEFLKLVAISCIVAFPISWYIMHNWLQNYAYRVEIKWWVFVTAGLAAIGIALFTVSFQAIKAAIANPIQSLRSE